VLAGTPAAGTGGTYQLVFTAHNGVGSDATQNFTLTVREAAAITNFARTLEAGELYREGWAPRVVVLRVRDLGRRGVLSQLNITLPLFFDNQVSALRQMGVPMSAIVEVRETIESTEGEARQIRGYASAHHFHRVIVVTSTYHTRRASRYLLCLAPDVQTIVRATRYEGAEPHDWWQWPVDRIDVLAEYMKWPKALVATFKCGR